MPTAQLPACGEYRVLRRRAACQDQAVRLSACSGVRGSLPNGSATITEGAGMASTVAEAMVATLRASGVRRVYGIPGDSLNGFTDALRRDGGITWEHVRHEEAAAFAAAAEAALTGELAVCAGSCGPGNLHLINGLFDANRSRVPVLAIAAHIPREEIGGGYFPGDPSAAAVRRVQRVLRAGQRARPGPVAAGDGDARSVAARRGRRRRHPGGGIPRRRPGPATTRARAGGTGGGTSR